LTLAEQIVYTEEQIQKASYPDLEENNLTTSKIPIKRINVNHGRVYYQRNVDEENRIYIYSSTTIIDNVMDKGYGFRKWLGDSLSMDHAEEYANKRAAIGTMTHAICMHLIWGETIDCRDGFLSED